MVNETPSTRDQESPLKPLSKSIWYALATIAGVADDIGDEDIIAKNRDYWNGYMRFLAEPDDLAHLKKVTDNKVILPQLSDEEIEHIHTTLETKGFNIADLRDLEAIDFMEFEFLEVIFYEFVFLKTVMFDHSSFRGDAHFQDAVFLSQASFEGVEFLEYVGFEFVVFGGNTWFDNSDFFNLAAFDATTFFGDVRFQGASFKKRLDFGSHPNEADKIISTRFLKSPPQFYNAKLSEDMSWSEVQFPSARGLTADEADSHKDSYERLALMMDRLKKHDDRYRFYRLEMRARRQMEKKWSLPRFINWSYEFLSDYGYGVGRTASVWGGNIILGAVLLGWDKAARFAPLSSESVSTAVQLTTKAAVTSFSNAHGFLGLGRGPLKDTVSAYQKADLLIPYNLIATGQAIFGTVFLFFFLLTLRNRFRMG